MWLHYPEVSMTWFLVSWCATHFSVHIITILPTKKTSADYSSKITADTKAQQQYKNKGKKQEVTILTPILTSRFQKSIRFIHLLRRVFMLFVFIYVYKCTTWVPYQMMFVLFNSNTTGATCGTGTADSSRRTEFTPGFSGVRVAPFLVFFVLFCRLLFAFWPFSFGYCFVCPSSNNGFWLLLLSPLY